MWYGSNRESSSVSLSRKLVVFNGKVLREVTLFLLNTYIYILSDFGL